MQDILPYLSPVRTGGVWTALASAGLLCGLLIMNLIRPKFSFWPAEEKWKKATALWLFRIFCAATVCVALLDLVLTAPGHWLRYAIGIPVMTISYALTLWGYRLLGIENTYFGSEGLVTTGLYAYSRNPQYILSVLATAGLGVAAGSFLTLFLAAVLFLVYFLFALNEERWLVKGYGAAFLDYMRKAPRFVDERTWRKARSDLAERAQWL